MWLLMLLAIPLASMAEDSHKLSTSGDGDSKTCADKQKCLELELHNWIGQLKDPKFQMDCTVEKSESAKKPQAPEVDPVFSIAKDCDQAGAIWHYKYTGAKGKRKMFTGKGKLSFSKHSSPPHGYDYGMKSGICLLLPDANVKGVEATFDAGGRPQGEGSVSFHDGRVVRGAFADGRLDGLAREYEPEVDKQTNLEKAEKRLCALSVYSGGVVGAGRWTLREDGTLLFFPVGGEKKLTLVVVPGANDTRQMLVGALDHEDMLLGATMARLVGLRQQDCLKVPEVERTGDAFDYDLQVRSKVNAATAKFVRFFELVANEEKALHTSFKAHSAPVDAKRARRLIDVKGYDQKSGVFRVVTPDGDGQAVTDGMKVKDGFPAGPHTIKILTDWRRRDVLPIAREKKKEAEEAEKIKKEKWEEMQAKNDEMHDTNDEANNKSPDEEKQETKEEDEDMAKIDSLLDSNATAGMSEADYEAYLDQFMPYDLLPYRPKPWARKIVKIHGMFDDSSHQLEGPVTVTYGDGSTLEGLAVDGCLHGIARHLDAPIKKGRRKRYVRKQVENMVVAVATGMMHGNEDPPREVNFVGSYRHGYIDGPGWQFLVGGTFLFGHLDKTLDFTTERGAFIQQDLLNCYLGSFKDSRMMAARPAQIVGGDVDESGIRVPRFSEPDAQSPVLRFVEQEPGQLVDPTVPDATEENWVEVRQSTLGPEVGDGLFARKDIPENTVVAFYGGYRVSSKEWNATKPLDPRYWMRVDGHDSVMHLPDDVGADLAQYRATLAHKINHSFSRWNCVFHSLDHPRFGLIPAARVVDSVAAGRELLCLYEYEFHEAAPWYQELWRRDIDSDFVYGPFGHRGERRNASQPIDALLDNGTLYNEFYRHAVETLGLEPVT